MLRYSLLPLWYTVFYEAYKSGAPVMRPMFYEFPNDLATFAMDDQWMVGSSLLVKPVTQANTFTVDVYLPPSYVWYDLETLRSIEGSSSHVNTKAPLEKIPVFVKGGSIIPRKMRLRRSSKLMFYDPITLLITPDASGQAEGSLYMDDEHTLAHETQSLHALVHFTLDKGTLECVIAEGSYRPVNTIERIVIAGQRVSPKRVRLSNTTGSKVGEDKDLTFVFNADADTVTIKKPDVAAVSRWTILLE